MIKDFSMVYHDFLQKKISLQEFTAATVLRYSLFFPINQNLRNTLLSSKDIPSTELENMKFFLENELFDLDIIEHVFQYYVSNIDKAQVTNGIQFLRKIISESQLLLEKANSC